MPSPSENPLEVLVSQVEQGLNELQNVKAAENESVELEGNKYLNV